MLSELEEELGAVCSEPAAVFEEEDPLDELQVEAEGMDIGSTGPNVVDELLQEKAAGLDVTPAEVHDDFLQGLVLGLSAEMGLGENLLLALRGEEFSEVLVRQGYALVFLFKDRVGRVVLHGVDAVGEAALDQESEESVGVRKVRLLDSVAHAEARPTLGVVEWRLAVHDEVQQSGYHSALYLEGSHLEVRLGELLEQDEELVKVPPVDPGAVHQLVDQEPD